VHIIEGTKKSFLGLISPGKYMIRETIERYAKTNNVNIKTKFENDEDRFLAESYYYYMTHPEKMAKGIKSENESGIMSVEEFDITGVNIQIVDVNKLNPKYMDPKLNLTKSNVRNIIVHIGYTFGEQTSNMIKGLIALFGKKIRSFNIIGKAGGFVGDRCDILVADKIIHYEKGDIFSNIDPSFNLKYLAQLSNKKIFVGPLLTAAGTIVQNKSLLNYYHKFKQCIGVEMEGFYFLKEIERLRTHGMLSPKVQSTFLYYISDLPLESDKLLWYIDYTAKNQSCITGKKGCR